MAKRNSIAGITGKNVEKIAKMENSSINRRSSGEMVADILAKLVGSWTFLIIQTALLICWVIMNVLRGQSWDPYPFVLLNLVLSFQAAYATPIILMSENRQARLAERRNQLDLQINLLAEQENTAQLKLLHLICKKLEIPVPEADETAYEQALRPEVIIRQIVASTNFDEPGTKHTKGK